MTESNTTLDERLKTIEDLCQQIADNQTDRDETSQAIADVTAAYRLVTNVTEGVEEIVAWMRQRITGKQQQQVAIDMENARGLLAQIREILQGYRNDQLQMRRELREVVQVLEALGVQVIQLRAAIELAIGQMPIERRKRRVLVNPLDDKE